MPPRRKSLRIGTAATRRAGGRRRGAISRAAATSGFDAACGAALRVFEGGRVPDDASVDVLARRIAGGEGDGHADLLVRDGFLSRGGEADAR